MTKRSLIRTGAVGLTCAAVGAGAGVIGSASGASPAAAGSVRAHIASYTPRAGRGLRALRRAVHVDAVVPGAAGTFQTITYDRGVLQSVGANQLTLREGTKRATYRSVTLTIPSGATVRLNRAPAQLSQLQPGDRVRVLAGPKRTVVTVSVKAPGTHQPNVR